MNNCKTCGYDHRQQSPTKQCYQDQVNQLQAENKELKDALNDMVFAYHNKDGENPHQFEEDALAKAQSLEL